MAEAVISPKGDVEFVLKEKGGGRAGRGATIDAGRVRSWEWGGIAAILVLAATLRIVGLNAPLWYDEVFTLTHFVREPWGALVQDFSSLNNHMFYSLQAKATLAVFGESPWALRVPALVFGLGSLVVLWVVGRRAAGRYGALIATFLTAISYHHVWFTQNARGYTGLLFWTSLATLILAASLRKPTWKLAVAYAACVAAGMYTHLSAGFFFAAHAVVYLGAVGIDRWRGKLATYPGLRDPRPFAGFALSGLFTLLLHLPILTQVTGAMGKVSSTAETSSMNEWQNPLRTLQEVIESLGPLGPIAPIAFVGGVGLILIGAAAIARRSPVLAAIYIVHIPLQLLMLQALNFRIWPRYFFVDIGFVFLCVAAGILAVSALLAPALRRVFDARLAAAAPATAAIIVATAASGVLLIKNYAEPKQDFAGAVAAVNASLRPGDIAASAGLANEPIHSYFAPTWPQIETAADLQGLMQPGRRVWVLTAFASNTERRHPDVAAILNRDFEIVERREGTLAGGSIRVYRSKGG